MKASVFNHENEKHIRVFVCVRFPSALPGYPDAKCLSAETRADHNRLSRQESVERIRAEIERPVVQQATIQVLMHHAKRQVRVIVTWIPCSNRTARLRLSGVKG